MILFNVPQENLFNYFSFFKPLEESIINSISDITSNIKFTDGSIQDFNSSKNYRTSKIKWIEFNNSSQKLFQTLESLIMLANNNYYSFDISLSMDNIQYTEYYGSNKGKYDWHVDTIPQTPNQRKLSMVIQLSDPSEYEGGELQIKKYSEIDEIFNIPRKKGLITVFPSYMIHRVTPVTKGIRKSLVWWVGGSKFK